VAVVQASVLDQLPRKGPSATAGTLSMLLEESRVSTEPGAHAKPSVADGHPPDAQPAATEREAAGTEPDLAAPAADPAEAAPDEAAAYARGAAAAGARPDAMGGSPAGSAAASCASGAAEPSSAEPFFGGPTPLPASAERPGPPGDSAAGPPAAPAQPGGCAPAAAGLRPESIAQGADWRASVAPSAGAHGGASPRSARAGVLADAESGCELGRASSGSEAASPPARGSLRAGPSARAAGASAAGDSAATDATPPAPAQPGGPGSAAGSPAARHMPSGANGARAPDSPGSVAWQHSPGGRSGDAGPRCAGGAAQAAATPKRDGAGADGEDSWDWGAERQGSSQGESAWPEACDAARSSSAASAGQAAAGPTSSLPDQDSGSLSATESPRAGAGDGAADGRADSSAGNGHGLLPAAPLPTLELADCGTGPAAGSAAVAGAPARPQRGGSEPGGDARGLDAACSGAGSAAGDARILTLNPLSSSSELVPLPELRARAERPAAEAGSGSGSGGGSGGSSGSLHGGLRGDGWEAAGAELPANGYGTPGARRPALRPGACKRMRALGCRSGAEVWVRAARACAVPACGSEVAGCVSSSEPYLQRCHLARVQPARAPGAQRQAAPYSRAPRHRKSACSCRRAPGMLHTSPDAAAPGAAAARAYRPADYAPAQLLVESSAFVPAPGLGSQHDWPDAALGPADALDWQGWGRAGPAGLQPPWDPPGYDPAVAPARAPLHEAAWAAPRPDPGPYDIYARMRAPYLLNQEPRYAAPWQAAPPAHPGPPSHALLQHWAWEAAAYGGGPWHTPDSLNHTAWPAARREAALSPPRDWPGRPQDADEQHSPGSTHGAGTPPPAGDDAVPGAGWEAGRAPKQRRSHNTGGAAEQRGVAEAPQPVGEAAAAAAPHRAAVEGAGLGYAAGAGAADAAAKRSDAPSSADHDRPNRCRPQRARQ